MKLKTKNSEIIFNAINGNLEIFFSDHEISARLNAAYYRTKDAICNNKFYSEYAMEDFFYFTCLDFEELYNRLDYEGYLEKMENGEYNKIIKLFQKYRKKCRKVCSILKEFYSENKKREN